MEKKTIEIGSHNVVVIDKLFGPMIFAKLRITPDTSRGWVIERQRIDTGEWQEQCVIPAQLEDEFNNEELL